MEVELVPYRRELRREVLELQQHLWGPHGDLNSLYLAWKHESNPYVDEPLIQLARLEGRVVAMRGFMGAAWECTELDEPVLIPVAGDLVVAPDHRGRGLVGRLMRSAMARLSERGVELVVNLSGNRYTHLSSLRSGWRDAGRLAPWALDLRPPRPGAESSVPSPLAHLDDSQLAEGIRLCRNAPVRQMAALISRLPWDGRLRHRRDESYLSWRLANPRAEYRVLTLTSDGGSGPDDPIDGYLVLQARARGGRRCSVADWEATSDDSAAALLEAATRLPMLERLTLWSATLGHGRLSVARSLGFRPHVVHERRGRPRFNALLVTTVGDGSTALRGRDLATIDSWDLRMIFSDAT